jgi:uncharacterized OsmC-like protein
MTIKTIYKGELRTECIHVDSKTSLNTDAPKDNHGRGESFSPTDLVATAAASCAITVLALQAQHDGVELKGTEIDVTKIMTKQPPRRIEKIIMDMKFRTNIDLSEETKRNYEDIARNCPVLLSLSQDLEKEIRFEWL